MKRLVATALALGLSTPAYAAPVPVGLWRMDSGKAEIRISDCGGAPCACGTVEHPGAAHGMGRPLRLCWEDRPR